MDRFASVGDNCIDRYLPPVGDSLVGGNAVNVAVQLAMLGRKIAYFGAVGDDVAGRAVQTQLAARGVDVAHVIVRPGQTTAHTVIETVPGGERHFVFEDFGACAAYAPSRHDAAVLRTKRHVHIGWLDDGGALKRQLAGAGVSVSQDLTVNAAAANLSPEGLSIAFCSAGSGAAEGKARQLLAAGAKLAVVTSGAAGSLASDGVETVSAMAPEIVPEDTTGAGDAFIAGFIDAHAAGRDLTACLANATHCAKLACLHRGGFPQTPLQAIFGTG